MNRIEKLIDRAKQLPSTPGCYLMKNGRNEVIYVGKAKNLKKRVISYFNESAKGPKTVILVGHIDDFDFMLTDTESSALVLENNLIKKYTPRYNIQMRDDKTYPYVQLVKTDNFPRLEYTRRPKRQSGTDIFGPFVFGSSISEVLNILNKTLKLRDCSDHEFKTRKVPCLLYQMEQCTAPCVGKISREDYMQDIEVARKFFKGEPSVAINRIKDLMVQKAEDEKFEYAALLRDSVQILNGFVNFGSEQSVEFNTADNIDLVSYYQGEIEVDIAFYMIRNGNVIGSKIFHFPIQDISESLEDEMMRFLLQYYSSTVDSLPKKVILTMSEEKMQLFQLALNELINQKVELAVPGRKYQQLYQVVLEQAQESQRIRMRNKDSVFLALEQLKDLLKLKERPRLIECYDVAVWQGKSPTAAQIVFFEGKPQKKNYRYYNLNERSEGNNDFAMMKEVLDRRLEKNHLPDLFIVDGGRAQLNVFINVLKEKKIDIPVVAIAKSKLKKLNERTDERLFISNRLNPVILKKHPALFKLVVQMRDEAHRFSRKLHHKKEKNRLLTSWLDMIPGVGAKTKKKIMEELQGDLKVLHDMNIEEMVERFSISSKLAQVIKDVAN